MLRVKKLTLTDFGPFKGQQEIVFPDSDGVVVIFGENCRGKTTLLNAIRYALFGKVLGRAAKEMALGKMLNWEARTEGKTEFSVSLEFTFASQRFELTRLGQLHGTDTKPEADLPVSLETFLKVDGHVLNQEDAVAKLNSIMPEQVSRFFLFDGELLEEYEELLGDESLSHREIKLAIEKILGVPILTNSITHLNEGSKEARKKELDALKRGKAAGEIALLLKQLQDAETQFEVDLGKTIRDLGDLKGQKMALESEMKQNEKAEKMILKRDFVKSELEGVEADIGKKKAGLVEASKTLWLGFVQGKVNQRINDLESERNAAVNRIQEAMQNQTAHLLIKQAVGKSHCPVCQSDLPRDKVVKLSSIPAPTETVGASGIASVIENVGMRAASLRKLVDVSGAAVAAHVARELMELKAKHAEKKIDLEELQGNIGNVDDDAIKSLRPQYDKIVKEIGIVEAKVIQIQKDLEDNRRKSEEARGKIPKETDSASMVATARRNLYDSLISLFDQGLANYRDRLKHHVAKEASSLFRIFSSDPDYESLKINANYGLTILHRDGNEIPVRSAGFEHIVALSLMGSLQKNAPLRGPIFMDSPMGRLDRKHKGNVVKALPEMSPQVILLVYHEEIDSEEVRKHLGTKLLAEYELSRRTSRHTEITRKGR